MPESRRGNVPPEIALQPFKVGLLQPPGYYPSFTKGAELARDEINAERVVRVTFVHRAERATPLWSP